MIYPMMVAMLFSLFIVLFLVFAFLGQVFSSIFFSFKITFKQSSRLFYGGNTPMLLVLIIMLTFDVFFLVLVLFYSLARRIF